MIALEPRKAEVKRANQREAGFGHIRNHPHHSRISPESIKSQNKH